MFEETYDAFRMVDNDSMFVELPQKDTDEFLVSNAVGAVIDWEGAEVNGDDTISSVNIGTEKSPIKDILAIK